MSSPDYTEIRSRLVRAVRHVCPGWLRGRADDIVQNALLKVLQIERSGEAPGGPAASYLWKVAYTATVDEIRTIRRRPEVPWESEDLDGAGPAGPAATDLVELGEATETCLRSLPDPRRIAVGLHLAGFATKEIAVALHWGEKTVRNLVFRGMAALRACLENKGFHA